MKLERKQRDNQLEPLILPDNVNPHDDFLRLDDEDTLLSVWARSVDDTEITEVQSLILSRERAIQLRDWLNKWLEK